MSSLKSSLLFVGFSPEAAGDLGADTVADLHDAQTLLRKNNYSVAVIKASAERLPQLKELAKTLRDSSSDLQIVVIHENLPAEKLREIVNLLSPFQILNRPDGPSLQRSVREALESHSLLQQNLQLLSLINEQNERLRKLSTELELRVEKRQKYLTNAREKLLTSNFRVEALHRALVAIHQADSIGDLENLLNQALLEAFKLSWVRILFHHQNFYEQQSEMNQFGFEIFSAPLVQGRDHIGQIYFARDKKRPFKKDEHNFLIQVSDAVALAIDRLNHLEQAKTLKQQWEATFDAITTPLSLISEDYKILRCNQAFAQQSAKPIQQIIGQACYAVLFQREKPCPQCRLGTSFRLTPQKTAQQKAFTFEVSSQKLDIPITQEQSYVVLYHDISDQQKWERQLIESAKMAEIGIIGSSIAHELNNPLGGMLSFLQLIKTDLKGNESYYEEIQEMEKGVQNCREIIQNLLSYTRRSSIDKMERFDVKQVLDQAVKLTELQTKSKGIELKLVYPHQETPVNGQKNLLIQAFRHLLQSLNQTLASFMAEDSSYHGEISLELSPQTDFLAIDIKTNWSGPNQKTDISVQSELPLTVTNQIIKEHSGTLEVFSQGERNFRFRVTLPRP